MTKEKSVFSMVSPKKRELIHMTRIPPEAPLEGQKPNLSKRFGAKFLTKAVSKLALFVS